MQINGLYIQDMHIFRDPSRVPVVLVEQHVINFPNNSSQLSLDQNDATVIEEENLLPKFSMGNKSSHVLHAVVFVHGFQVYPSLHYLLIPSTLLILTTIHSPC